MNDKRKSLEYKEWRDRVKHRDGNACRKCRHDDNLHIHHIKPFKKYPDFALVLDNGVTLCGNCHSLLKGKEETENLRAFLGNDPGIGRQLRAIDGSFFVYLERKLKSENQMERSQAVSALLSHLASCPSSLRKMLPLLVYIVDSEKWPDDSYPKPKAVEWLSRETERGQQRGAMRTTWQTPATTETAANRAVRRYKWRAEQRRIQEERIQQQQAAEKEEETRRQIHQAKEYRQTEIGCTVLGWGAVIAIIVVNSKC